MLSQNISQTHDVDQEFFIQAGNIAQVIENLSFQMGAACDDPAELRSLRGEMKEQICALGTLLRSASSPSLTAPAA